MATYSTNFMGPISEKWYHDRGINSSKERWAGGRIDVYGLDEHEYYGGKYEYGLPIMDGESWELFSQWLEEYESVELKEYDQLLSEFEGDTGYKIRWADEEFVEVK